MNVIIPVITSSLKRLAKSNDPKPSPEKREPGPSPKSLSELSSVCSAPAIDIPRRIKQIRTVTILRNNFIQVCNDAGVIEIIPQSLHD